MFNRKYIIFSLLSFLIVSNSGYSAIYWVGDSAACTGSNVRDSLPLALLSAAFSAENDEVRLTSTISYTGGAGHTTLTDWNPGATGSITISGGYSDCFAASNGSRTLMGNNASFNVIDVEVSSQPSSVVTLKNLNLVGGAFRGIVATGNVDVTLDNVRIADNPSGIFVNNGAYIKLMANSIIEDNIVNGNTGNGGGIECAGTNSQVDIYGKLKKNRADKGGQLYLRDGCYVELYGGAVIEGRGFSGGIDAIDGAGIYVANGGELFSNGGANRVSIFNNIGYYGGGLYIVDSGKATLLNTAFTNNIAQNGNGGAIYAANGGTSTPQIIMDRVGPCPFGYSCSEIEGTKYNQSIVFASNSLLEFNRTIIELSDSSSSSEFAYYVVSSVNNAIIRLNRVGIVRNKSNYLIGASTGGKVDVVHGTMAENYYEFEANTFDPWVTLNVGEINFQNSIFADTQGTDTRGGSRNSRCNLVDDSGDMIAGSFDIGTAIFNNSAAGDIRQMSASSGVDMCNQDTFTWTGNDKDIEYQDSPVNDSTNQQGMPGDVGGLFDAGYDENYTNIGEDLFVLNVLHSGTGSGTVVSTNPLGIACGSDCMEILFNGTVVEMTAIPDLGNVVAGWSGCDIASGNSCALSMTGHRTVTAIFAPDDLIFANDFE